MFWTVARYWYTLRYLRSVQIAGRIRRLWWQPKVDCSVADDLRAVSGAWVLPAQRGQRMLAERSFCFLNEVHEIVNATDWNNNLWTKLWLYNLHYFDDLTATDACQRKNWHSNLMRSWINENPPGEGNGWEPYPSSLRIVNWVKWALSGHVMEPDVLHSLAVQTRFLTRNLETHLLGNHLFSNAKALLFAGLFFEGSEAKSWYDTGRRLVERELPEQVLADGGNFELSTMYHVIFLEDLLDLVNLHRAYDCSLPNGIEERIPAMFSWLLAMCHPDGEISFFNDAALGVTPTVQEIQDYASRLGNLGLADGSVHFGANSLIDLPASGYSRVQMGPMVALIDRAAVGPDFLPGHAHADTLSFELSLFGRRVIINSGSSVYGTGTDRQQERGTSAHATVVLDGHNSSEVWGGFRVARRARVLDRFQCQYPDEIQLAACHDGYKRLSGKPVHSREWLFTEKSLTIVDRVTGKNIHEVESILPLHPDVGIDEIRGERAVLSVNGIKVVLGVEGNGELKVVASDYHPEFGLSVESRKLVFSSRSELPIEVKMRLVW